MHIHVPAGAVPKDGPSAGIAMATVLLSLMLERAVDRRTAMTGEVTLTGDVLPIGGLLEKVLAAHRAGIRTVILPADNEPDLESIPAEVREVVTFVPVSHVTQVWETVFPGLRLTDPGSGRQRMLDILKTLFMRHKDVAFRVPGAIGADSRILAVATPDLADLVFHAPLLRAIRRALAGGGARRAGAGEPRAPGGAQRPGARGDRLRAQATGSLAAGLRLAAAGPRQDRLRRRADDVALPAAAARGRGPGQRGGRCARVAAIATLIRNSTSSCGRPTRPRGYLGDLPRRLATLPRPRRRRTWCPAGRSPRSGCARRPSWCISTSRARSSCWWASTRPWALAGTGWPSRTSSTSRARSASEIACRILPLSGPGDPERPQRFEGAARPACPSGLKRDTVLDTMLLLCQCDLFVAGNTDLFHVAVAHGVPTIGLFSPQDDESLATRRRRVVAHRSP